MSARTYLTVFTVAGALALAGPDAYSSLSAGAAAFALSDAGTRSVSAESNGQTGQDLTTTLDDSDRAITHGLQLRHRTGA